MIYKKLNIKVEDIEIQEDLNKCYYLSKPIIKALGSSLIKTLNKFNQNMIFMLEQHEKSFNRLDKNLIINQTKWVYQNYNIFPNEQYFNKSILNVTLPCYAIDTNFVNIESFTKDLVKTLIGCNIIDGSGCTSKIDNPIDVNETDIKWLQYDIDRFYNLLSTIPDQHAQDFIFQVLNMIKQNTARYSDIVSIVKRISIKKEELDPLKNYDIFTNLTGIASTFCNPTKFFTFIDTDDVLSNLLKNTKSWDIDKITNEYKNVFNNLDTKISNYFNNTVDNMQVIDKYKLVSTIKDNVKIKVRYDETLQTHPLLDSISHWSVIPDEDIKKIETIIFNLTQYKGKKLDKNMIIAYTSGLRRLLEILEYYKLNYNSQIWEHIGCKNDILEEDSIVKPNEMKFGQL